MITSDATYEDRRVVNLNHDFVPLNQLTDVFPVVATLTPHREIRDTVHLSLELVADVFVKQQRPRLVQPEDVVIVTRTQSGVSQQRAL